MAPRVATDRGELRKMKHATPETLDRLQPLLEKLSAMPALAQRSRGVYSLKSKAFLHFHEDAAGIFADVSDNGSWSRVAVNSKKDEVDLLRLVSTLVAERSSRDVRKR